MEFIETHRICVHMVPKSVPTRIRFRLGPGFHRFHIGSALRGGNVECCAKGKREGEEARSVQIVCDVCAAARRPMAIVDFCVVY